MACGDDVAADRVPEAAGAGVVGAGGQDAFDAEVRAFAAVVIGRHMLAGRGMQPALSIRGSCSFQGRDAQRRHVEMPVGALVGRLDLAGAAAFGNGGHLRQRRVACLQGVQAHRFPVAAHLQPVGASRQKGVNAEVGVGPAVVVACQRFSGGIFQHAHRIDAAGGGQGDGAVSLYLESPVIDLARTADHCDRASVPGNCRQGVCGSGRMVYPERVVSEAIVGASNAHVVGAAIDIPFNAKVASSAAIVIHCQVSPLVVFEAADGVRIAGRFHD